MGYIPATCHVNAARSSRASSLVLHHSRGWLVSRRMRSRRHSGNRLLRLPKIEIQKRIDLLHPSNRLTHPGVKNLERLELHRVKMRTRKAKTMWARHQTTRRRAQKAEIRQTTRRRAQKAEIRQTTQRRAQNAATRQTMRRRARKAATRQTMRRRARKATIHLTLVMVKFSWPWPVVSRRLRASLNIVARGESKLITRSDEGARLPKHIS